MGYQESFRPIIHLAESAGIKKAIEDYKDNPHIAEYCSYYCTARDRNTGRLYACIGGQRCRVHIVARHDVDDYVPYGEKYSDYFEDLDESLIDEAAREHPDVAERAYKEVAASFEREAKEGIKWEEGLRNEAIDLWPTVAKIFCNHGPSKLDFFKWHPALRGHFMHNVMVELERQGLIKCDGNFFKDNLWLTDEALQLLGIEGPPQSRSDEERLTMLLDECGKLSTSTLSVLLGKCTSRTRSMLRKLIDQGRVVPVGNGRSRKYALVEPGGEANK